MAYDEDEMSDITGDYGSVTRKSASRSSSSRRCTNALLSMAIVFLAVASLGAFVFVVFVSFESGEKVPWKVSKGSLPPSLVANMDLEANPCDDFYEFSCGGFLGRIGVPKDREEWALAWDAVESKTREYLEDLVANDTGRAGKFYQSCMDHDDVEALGGLPLAPFLKMINKVQRYDELIHAIALLHSIDVSVLFNWEVLPNPHNPVQYALTLIPGGLTLSNREMYVEDSPSGKHRLTVFEDIVKNTLVLAGVDEDAAEEQANTVVKTETMLASMISSPSQQRPPQLLDLHDLSNLAPKFMFPAIFSQLAGGDKNLPLREDWKNIVVQDQPYFREVSHWLQRMRTRSLLPYLRFRVAFQIGPLLSKDFLHQSVRLSQLLTGIEAAPPSTRRCYDITAHNLPNEIGLLYVTHQLDDRTREAAVSLLESVREGFRDVLASSTWLLPETRKIAVAKLDNMIIEVGHPSEWHVTTFDIHTDTFAGNVFRAREDMIKRAMDRLSKPIDRRRWGYISVSDATTFYARSLNTLFVPAAMLQEPFFSLKYADARNMGGLGAVVAHEMAHGFDQVGRHFGPQRQLQSWWQRSDKANYLHKEQCLVNLYDTFDTPQGPVNGSRTLEENIADLTGVTVAYASLERQSRKSSGKVRPPAAMIDEEDKENNNDDDITTHDKLNAHQEISTKESQLFFVSYAQTWCSVTRSRLAALKLKTDPHAPDAWRCNGPLSQFPHFAQVFGCPAGSTMNPFSRCHFW